MRPILSAQPIHELILTYSRHCVKQYGQFDVIVIFEYYDLVDARNAKTPGQLVKALLDDKGWTQSVLAVVLGVDNAIVVRMVNDKRPIEASMALKLADVFGVPAEVFFDLQKNFQLGVARVAEAHDPGLKLRAALFGSLPIAEMIKRGWLDAENVRDVHRVEAALVKFFGVKSIDEIEFLPHAAKKTNVSEDVTPPQLAWLYRVKQIANDMLVGRYSPASVDRAIARLATLTSAAEEARKVPQIMAESGIRFVIVESLAAAKIDGVCFWLNDMAPVIGLSLRFDRIDNFYFVLRHEIEHVRRRHGREIAIVDAELEGDRAGTTDLVSEEERVANEAAANFCVPRTKMEKFVTVKAPFYAERDIIGFARTLNIHPGLVAGQLQHKTGRYDRFRDHLVKVRSIVTPGAMVDGWGDVAPVGQ
jgi:HTH-type transcriptional regulator/antitoxin HigA